MPLLMSPIVWVLVFAYFFIFKKTTPEPTDLGIFADTTAPVIDPKTGKPKPTVTHTASGHNVIGATINVAKAKVISATLVEQFGALFSSESEILDTIKNLNAADFILVYDQFGTTHVRSYLGNEGLGSDGEDLITWFTKEITSEKNKAKLHKQFPAIF